jgi:hypothetical protein
VRVVVGILGLLLVPAMSSVTGELDPGVVVAGNRLDGGEVATGAGLSGQLND